MFRLTTILLTTLFATYAVSQETATVTDGDTVQQDGVTYRLHGIDAPEFGQKCGDAPCGQLAVDAMAELVERRRMECDVREIDQYGRAIAVCLVDGVDIGAEMVRQGKAWAYVRFSDDYVALEASARDARKGIWQSEAEAPWDYRERNWNNATSEAPEGCPIKGNISQNGKIYHTPWSPWYSRTRINTSKGERWFCNEGEALAAGWRAPRWR